MAEGNALSFLSFLFFSHSMLRKSRRCSMALRLKIAHKVTFTVFFLFPFFFNEPAPESAAISKQRKLSLDEKRGKSLFPVFLFSPPSFLKWDTGYESGKRGIRPASHVPLIREHGYAAIWRLLPLFPFLFPFFPSFPVLKTCVIGSRRMEVLTFLETLRVA